MLLAFDVGNTNIVLGVFKDGELIQNWRLETDPRKSADEYGMVINQLFKYEGLDVKDVEDIIIATVVPSVLYTLQHLSVKYFNKRAIVVGPGVKTGLIVKYDNPKQVGADRIVNAVAAIEEYDGPLIIVDFGTATTYCYINEHKQYMGGAIAPGIGISTEALYSRAAKLPRIEIVKPEAIVGKSTVAAMQAGILYGYVGQVDGIVSRMKAESSAEPKVIATGGLSALIASESNVIDVVDPFLTLKGLKLIYHRNKEQTKK